MLTGCVASADVRHVGLPSRSLVVADPMAPPEPQAGQDAVVAAAEARRVAAENARRLRDAQVRYDQIVTDYR